MPSRNYPMYVKAPHQKRQSHDRKFPMSSLLLILIVVSIASILVGKVYLERRTFQMGLEWSDVHEELQTVRKTQANLEMELERYTDGDYIKPRARAMGLEPARPGQVRMMWQEHLPVVANLD